MKKLVFPLLSVVFFLIVSCTKEPGEGGLASISGKLYEYKLNAFNTVIDSGYVTDTRVYIIYGDEDKTYDDDFKTSYDGSYRFDNLTRGDYTVFAYSDDTVTGDKTVVKKTVTISEKKDHLQLGDLITYNK